MKAFWNKLHRIGDILHLPDMPNWVLGILALVLILRIPSFFEPYYYGDEMIYMTLGQGVRQGLTLYKDVHDNKPPLIYLLAAVSENLFWFKTFLLVFNIVSIFLFYKLSTIFFENEKARKISTFLFAVFTTIPLLEGNTVNAELFMVAPILGALILLFKQNVNTKNIFVAGLLFGIAALFKIPAAFELPVVIFFWIFTRNLKTTWKKTLKESFVLSLGFLTPILLTFIWYFVRGALSEYIKAAFLQNVGYLSSFRPQDTEKSIFERNLPLLVRGFAVFLGGLILFFYRNFLSKKFIFFSLWTLFALFAITLSERPYPHYLIQVVAPGAFLFALLFTEKRFEQVLSIFPLTLIFTVPFIYHFWYYPTSEYYLRFFKFASHQTDKAEYFSGFTFNAERNYKIADFLVSSTKRDDRVFVWDEDAPSIYALSRRLPGIKFVVPYHVNDFANRGVVAELLEKDPPKFIVLSSNLQFPEIKPVILNKYILVNQIGNLDVWSRIGEGLRK